MTFTKPLVKDVTSGLQVRNISPVGSLLACNLWTSLGRGLDSAMREVNLVRITLACTPAPLCPAGDCGRVRKLGEKKLLEPWHGGRPAAEAVTQADRRRPAPPCRPAEFRAASPSARPPSAAPSAPAERGPPKSPPPPPPQRVCPRPRPSGRSHRGQACGGFRARRAPAALVLHPASLAPLGTDLRSHVPEVPPGDPRVRPIVLIPAMSALARAAHTDRRRGPLP